MLLVITPLLLCGFMIFAGVKMWGLQARTAVLAASVLAMIVVPGNIIGLPLGIWALVTLSRREVWAAFAGDQATLAAVLRTTVRPHAVWPWIVATGAMALLLPVLLPAGLGLGAGLLAKSNAVRQQRLAAEQASRALEQARLAAETGQFRARLPQGEIELVGVSFHPSTTSRGGGRMVRLARKRHLNSGEVPVRRPAIR